MADTSAVIPPPPPGFTLDGVPPPPAGFTLDGAQKQKEMSAGDLAKGIAVFAAQNFIPGMAGLHAMDALSKGANKVGEVVNDNAAKILPAPVAAGLGVAANVGINSIPMLLGGEGAKVAAPAMRGGAEWLMQSALKPNRAELLNGKAAKAIDTMLEEGVNVSKGGVATLKGSIDELEAQLKDVLRSSPAAMVDKAYVASTLQQLKDRLLVRDPANWEKNGDSIRKAWMQFKENPMISGSSKVPVELANEMKRGVYAGIGDKRFGTPAGVDALEILKDKAIGRGLKEGVESVVPEVAPINAKMGELINAAKMAERRSMMENNNNLIGLGALSHSPMNLAIWLADRYGAGKSVAARMMNAGQEQIPASAARAAIAAYEASNQRKNP